MTQTMHAMNAGLRALRFEALQLVAVAQLGRNQAAIAGELLGLGQQRTLFIGADRHFAVFAALGPTLLQAQHVAGVRPGRH